MTSVVNMRGGLGIGPIIGKVGENVQTADLIKKPNTLIFNGTEVHVKRVEKLLVTTEGGLLKKQTMDVAEIGGRTGIWYPARGITEK